MSETNASKKVDNKKILDFLNLQDYKFEPSFIYLHADFGVLIINGVAFK